MRDSTYLINLRHNKCKQELRYYLCVVKLSKCVESCHAVNDLSNRTHVPNKTEDLSIHVFNMIAGKNESKTLTEDISWQCKCRLDGKNVIQINDGITINIYMSIKNVMYVKKIIFGILLHAVVKMEDI